MRFKLGLFEDSSQLIVFEEKTRKYVAINCFALKVEMINGRRQLSCDDAQIVRYVANYDFLCKNRQVYRVTRKLFLSASQNDPENLPKTILERIAECSCSRPPTVATGSFEVCPVHFIRLETTAMLLGIHMKKAIAITQALEIQVHVVDGGGPMLSNESFEELASAAFVMDRLRLWRKLEVSGQDGVP